MWILQNGIDNKDSFDPVHPFLWIAATSDKIGVAERMDGRHHKLVTLHFFLAEFLEP